MINVLWRCFGIGSVVAGAVLAIDALSSSGGASAVVGAGAAIVVLGVGTFFIGPLRPSHLDAWFRAFGMSTQSQSHVEGSATPPNKSLERTREV
jgi:hypothetical protein